MTATPKIETTTPVESLDFDTSKTEDLVKEAMEASSEKKQKRR